MVVRNGTEEKEGIITCSLSVMAETGENDAYHEVKFSWDIYNLFSYIIINFLLTDPIFRVHLSFFFLNTNMSGREESHVYCLLMKHLT